MPGPTIRNRIISPALRPPSRANTFVTKQLSVSKTAPVNVPVTLPQRPNLPNFNNAVENNPETFMVFNNKELTLPQLPKVNLKLPNSNVPDVNIAVQPNPNRNFAVFTNLAGGLPDRPVPAASERPVLPSVRRPLIGPQLPAEPREAQEPRILPQPVLPNPVDLSVPSQSFQLEDDNNNLNVGRNENTIDLFDLSNIDIDKLPVENLPPPSPRPAGIPEFLQPVPAVPGRQPPPRPDVPPPSFSPSSDLTSEEEIDLENDLVISLLDRALPANPNLPVRPPAPTTSRQSAVDTRNNTLIFSTLMFILLTLLQLVAIYFTCKKSRIVYFC